MSQLEPFVRRLASVSARAARRLTEHKSRAGVTPGVLASRQARHHELAARWLRGVVQPRFEALAAALPHATLTGPAREVGDLVSLELPYTPRFPAQVRLECRLSHDAELERIVVVLASDFRPRFCRLDGPSELSQSPARADDEALAVWLEDGLARFLETYLRLEFVDRTQRAVLVTDPVCGVRFAKLSAAAELELGGEAFWFVTTAARDRFARQPGKYAVWGGKRPRRGS